jgi:hypothetical protein
MRDTWDGNRTSRLRDREPALVAAAFRDPVSYLNRKLPTRMKNSMSSEMLSTVGRLNALEAKSNTGKGGARKFVEAKSEAVPVHLRSNFNVSGSSVIHKAPPRPLTSAEQRSARQRQSHRQERVAELGSVRSYLAKSGRFWMPASKLVVSDELSQTATLSSRPLTAPPIRAARARKSKARKEAVPNAGAFKKRAIDATVFRKYYERGDLPVKIDHCAGGNKVSLRAKRARRGGEEEQESGGRGAKHKEVVERGAKHKKVVERGAKHKVWSGAHWRSSS